MLFWSDLHPFRLPREGEGFVCLWRATLTCFSNRLSQKYFSDHAWFKYKPLDGLYRLRRRVRLYAFECVKAWSYCVYI